MTLYSLVRYLWAARFLLHAGLLAWMIVRRFYRDFPIFVLYTGEKVLQASILQAIRYSSPFDGRLYFMVFTVGSLLRWVLSFAVIYEIFKRAFRDYPALCNLGTNLFRGTTVFFLLIGVGLAWLKPADELRMVVSKVDLIEQTVCLVQCGLVVVLLFCAKKVGLSLQSRTFGIALGFGILASVNLATFAIRSRFESPQASPTTDLLTLITMAAALCSVAVWTAYVMRPETAMDSFARMLPSHDMETWTQELRRLLRP
ncbi:MAG: hypothetical protein WB952_22010 [Terriglobales bacterium]